MKQNLLRALIQILLKAYHDDGANYFGHIIKNVSRAEDELKSVNWLTNNDIVANYKHIK